MGIALAMITAGVLPMPIVYLLRRFQCLKVDLDIHQGSIRRNETTASTKEMIDEDEVRVRFEILVRREKCGFVRLWLKLLCNNYSNYIH